MNAVNHNYCTSVSLFILSQKCYAIALLQSGLKKMCENLPHRCCQFPKTSWKENVLFRDFAKNLRKNVLFVKMCCNNDFSDFIDVSRKYFLPNSEDSCSNVFLWQKLLILPPGKPTHTHIRSFSCCPSPYHIISLFVFFTNILNKLLNLLSWSPPPQV